ncbi:MAG: TrkH family potassium uptake protein [Planctomycetota bacterium]|nr:MAG: TrkH family potassium uptake protein [Planctomycetota bacterium]
MNLRAVVRMLGIVLLLIAGFLLVPALVALIYDEVREFWACVLSAALSAAVGGFLAWWNRSSTKAVHGRPDYFRREGLAVVGLSWLVGGVAGALPYMFTGTFSSFVDALFESVSGLTTTGSTVLSPEGIDALPMSIAFWRSFTHWLGGFGIVMVFVVIFPTGGRSLFRSEVPGIAREAGRQRVRDSALALMRIYVGISVIEFVLLYLAGMTVFDSVIHTFGTIATGGFSNHSESIAYFQSVQIEMIITVFMFVSGINFAIYDVLLRVGPRPAWRRFIGSAEARAYAGIIFGSTVFIACVLWFWGGSNGDVGSGLPDYRHFWQAMRDSVFQVVCLETSTGYGTADFDRWPQVCRVLLMLIAVIGACAGSTGGGMKVVRILIVAKAALNGVRRFVRPRAIHAVRMDGQTLDEGIVASVTSYFALWIFVFLGGTLFLSGYGYDLATSSTAVLATLNNIGPGLAKVGPAMNFAELPDLGKLLLTVFMVLGRLEFYAVVALFVPSFWRR